MKNTIYFILLTLIAFACQTKEATQSQQPQDTVLYHEAYRPQIHFSPEAHWMNDPNGMVYYDGEYHLFYQHYPDSTVWGPMHWGHAVSSDLIHWSHLPIALYPDSLGLIFSGSAVVDVNNTTGFGTKENPAMVAMFTYHSMEKEKAGATDYQNQGLAYSTDKGRTWTKYKGNPVLKNQGIQDFRDPKVFWDEGSKKWIVILAVKDHIELWNSPDLQSWTKLSDFGFEYGAHGGVWECPDLFKLKVDGENKENWVMLVSINPGGPNGGSATQYFVGNFDGKVFTPDGDKNKTRWLDYGPDDYAGVTWGNIGGQRKIFLGWMSNWAYGQEVPTKRWRSAMTVPRDLKLKRINGQLYVTSAVAPELAVINSSSKIFRTFSPENSSRVDVGNVSKAIITGTFEVKDFSIVLSNNLKQHVDIIFDSKSNKFIIDRTHSGKTDFSKGYTLTSSAPRISSAEKITVTIVSDVSSVEVFFDDGLTVMTSVFFPDQNLTDLSIRYEGPGTVENLTVQQLNSIWE